MTAQQSDIETTKALYSAFASKDVPAILGLLPEEVQWGEPENPFNPAGRTR